MPQLVTIDCTRYYFHISTLAGIAENDANTGKRVTTVYGVSARELHIGDSPQTFLHRIGAGEQFVRLTRLDDSGVWINAPAVGVIRSPGADEFPTAARCVIPLGTPHAVKESMETVRQLLNAHGAGL